MYDSFYHLTAEPFRLTPDHRLAYRHPSYERAMIALQHALHLGEGFIMVTGRPGMGKTTLINDLLTSLDTQRAVAKLDCIHLGPGELLRMVAFSLGLTIESQSTATIMRSMREFLTKQHEAGLSSILILDEAQALSSAALDELRLLSNMQQNGEALLQIFLAGQERLGELMLSPVMEQLQQRMLAACHLEPLSVEHTHIYVKHRLKAVGWTNDPELSEDIFPIIYKFSRGIPRPINMLCSRLLLNGYMNEKHKLDASDVQQTIEDLGAEKLAPFINGNHYSQTVEAQIGSSKEDLSNSEISVCETSESQINLSCNQVNSSAALSKHSKESNLWRLTLVGFIAGVTAAVCFVAVVRFFNG